MSIRVEEPDQSNLNIPATTLSEASSSETLMGEYCLFEFTIYNSIYRSFMNITTESDDATATSAPSSPGNLSSTTLVPSNGSVSSEPSTNNDQKSSETKTTTLEEIRPDEQTPKAAEHYPFYLESSSATSSPLHLSR